MSVADLSSVWVVAEIFEADAIGITEALTPDGYLRTTPAIWPELGGMDGFFVARFTKA